MKKQKEVQNEEKKTATEMMVRDMQEEEYYRIKHTPTQSEKEWKEKWRRLAERFCDEGFGSMPKYISYISIEKGEQFIDSLLSQKDKDIIRRIKIIGEGKPADDFERGYDAGLEDAIKEILKLTK